MKIKQKSDIYNSNNNNNAIFRLIYRLIFLSYVLLLLPLSPLLAQESSENADSAGLKTETHISDEYIFGYRDFHFYMTVDEVKAKIEEKGLAKSEDLEEYDSDLIATYPAIRQDNVFYDHFLGRYYDVSVFDGDLKEFLEKSFDNRIDLKMLHLGERYKGDFKMLRIPANFENGQFFEYRFVFFVSRGNNLRESRLFAISLFFNFKDTKIGNFHVTPPGYAEILRKRFYKEYGNPHTNRTINMRNLFEKTYETYNFGYKSLNYEENADEPGNFSHNVQMHITYNKLTGGLPANFQINYIAVDYLRRLLPDFSSLPVDYDNVDIDQLIDIEF